MSELVSRSYLKKELNKSKKIRDFERENDRIIFDILNKAPTVDLYRDVEFKSDGSVVYRFRPTGEWKDYSDEGFLECPFCQHATTCENNSNELHFCFSCGAELKMPVKECGTCKFLGYQEWCADCHDYSLYHSIETNNTKEE